MLGRVNSLALDGGGVVDRGPRPTEVERKEEQRGDDYSNEVVIPQKVGSSLLWPVKKDTFGGGEKSQQEERGLVQGFT